MKKSFIRWLINPQKVGLFMSVHKTLKVLKFIKINNIIGKHSFKI